MHTCGIFNDHRPFDERYQSEGSDGE
jgi:hypothetical protein